MNKYMEKALLEAQNGSRNGEGGPFGAAIVSKTGEIISLAHNQVLVNNDPTAHAEIQAIRNACKILNTYNLKDYTLYTSCEPCPMCLSAAIWANIEDIYYGCTKEDAGKIGFRDDLIYEYLEGKNNNLLNKIELDRNECLQVFNEYDEENRTIY